MYIFVCSKTYFFCKTNWIENTRVNDRNLSVYIIESKLQWRVFLFIFNDQDICGLLIRFCLRVACLNVKWFQRITDRASSCVWWATSFSDVISADIVRSYDAFLDGSLHQFGAGVVLLTVNRDVTSCALCPKRSCLFDLISTLLLLYNTNWPRYITF